MDQPSTFIKKCRGRIAHQVLTKVDGILLAVVN